MTSPFGSNSSPFNPLYSTSNANNRLPPQQQPPQLVPLQTTTTYVPLPSQTSSSIPSLYSNSGVVPPMYAGTNTIPRINPIFSTTSQNIPRPISPPIRPTTGNLVPMMPQIPPLATSPLSPPRSNYLDEDYQMNLAINESLKSIPVVHSPRRDTFYSPPRIEEDLDDVLLQEAIRMSMEASNQAKTANYHASQVTTPQILSPRNDKYSESRLILSQQERDYEESLRQDRKRQEEAQLAAEAALKASKAAEEAARLVQVAQQREKLEKSQFMPPTLTYPIESSSNTDILHLRFRLPTGATVNHSFNRYEPLRSVHQQLRFDMRSNDKFTLSIPPRTIITCSEDSSLFQCGIENRTMINVL